jgi:phosphoribosylglycinamide formyltransferase-1
MSSRQTLKLGFLVSHGGSSMKAVVAAIRSGALDAQALIVISNNADCAAMTFARDQRLQHRHISATTEGSFEASDGAIADALEAAGVDLVVLSGYLRPLGPQTIARLKGRILNIHPGLLPRYGGKGMYGRRVHEAVLASGDSETGATIHLVDGDYDTGPIVAQARVPVTKGDTVEDVEARVMAAEPGLFVQTLQRISEGALDLPVSTPSIISDNLP